MELDALQHYSPLTHGRVPLQALPKHAPASAHRWGSLLRSSVAANSIISFTFERPSAGIGFAKTGEGNCALVGGLPRVRAQLRGALRGMPLLVGPSRKGFLGQLTGAGCQGHPSGLRGMLLSVVRTCA